MSAAVAPVSWHGRLELDFERHGPRTVLARSRAQMPLALQRPFYPEGPAVCHAVVLHPPGGMVGGDRLEIELDLAAHAEALITTPAAAKWYRGISEAGQNVTVRVAEGAHLEWLPQEAIVFDGAIAAQTLHIELAPGATWLGWDVTRFGRSARGERFRSGFWRSFAEVWRADRPLWVDRQALAGGSRLLTGAYGLAGQPVIGTLAWLGCEVSADVVAAARAAWGSQPRAGEAGVTRLTEGLLCRYRGPSSAEARAWFVAVWDLLRRAQRARPACAPRIWNT